MNKLLVHEYEAVDSQGHPYVRPARAVHELPTPAERARALQAATREIERVVGEKVTRPLAFGLPVYTAFGWPRQRARAHAARALLLAVGGDVPLQVCPEWRGVVNSGEVRA